MPGGGDNWKPNQKISVVFNFTKRYHSFFFLIWLHQVLIAVHGVFVVTCGVFHEGSQTLQLWCMGSVIVESSLSCGVWAWLSHYMWDPSFLITD